MPNTLLITQKRRTARPSLTSQWTGQAGTGTPGDGTWIEPSLGAGTCQMQSESGNERDEWRSSEWWAVLAGKLLHPAQVASIEALSYIGLALCIADLAKIVEDIDAVHLDYHVGRLRKLGALEFADSLYASQKDFADVRYRLAREMILGDGHDVRGT